jgi:type IV pilus assembly protein PilV
MKRARQFPKVAQRRQSGSFLLEALISLLLFSIGLIGLVAVSSQAVNFVGQSKIRNDASFLAGELIGDMWVSAATPATYDTTVWAARIQSVIPGATTTVNVTNNTSVYILITWPDKKDASAIHQYETTANIGKNS